MISLERVYNQLQKQSGFISVVKLAMILEANTAEVRQRLTELGDRVTGNEHDEWRITGELVHKLKLLPLSVSEIEERNKLENVVQQAFYVAGQALMTLRNKKLYRETHTTFESYVRDRFGYSKRKAYYLIDAYEVVNSLKSEPLVHLLPTSERQCREVAKLPPKQQHSGWLKAVERAGNKIPPARIIKQVVREIKGEPQMKPKKNQTDGIVRVPGIGIEYTAHLEEETYYLLKEYQYKIGAATKNGAIKRLLDEHNATVQEKS